MKKIKYLVLLLVLLLLLVIGFLFSPLFPRYLAKGIEHFGSKAMKTDVSLEKIDLSILDGSISLQNLEISSPEGFSSKAFRLDNVFVDLDIKSVFKEVIVIDSILVQSPKITLEKQGRNLNALLKGMEPKKEIKETKETSKKDEVVTAEKKVIIKSLLVQDAKVAVGDAFNINLPDISIKDLGEEKEPLKASIALYDVLSIVSKDSLGALASKGKETLKDIEDTAKDFIKGFFK